MRCLAEHHWDQVGQSMEHWQAQDTLGWAARTFSPRLTFATGFGAEGCVVIDMIARHRLPVDVFTLDTGLLFPETYDLWGRLEQRYGIRIRVVRPELTVEAQASACGPRLWERDPDQCCAMRKVRPFRQALHGFEAWITAIRRDQTPERVAARLVEWDRTFGLTKVNPLLRWRASDVWNYLRQHDVPYNPLHEAGYPSIGCVPCTTRVAAGEHPRAGRWRGDAKTECGLHRHPEELAREPIVVPTQGPQNIDVCVATGDAHARGQEPSASAMPISRTDQALAPSSSPVFPIFLKLRGRKVVLVGGGTVASSKLQALRDASSRGHRRGTRGLGRNRADGSNGESSSLQSV